MNCLHCHAPTSNGLALCELCRRKVSTDLEFLPVYFRNLARWRPGRAGTRQVPGSRVLYDGVVRGAGTGDRISDTLDETFTALTTWARTLTGDRSEFVRPLTFADAVLTGDLPDDVAEELNDDKARAASWLCFAFEQHLTTISTLEWAGEFVRGIDEREGLLRDLTERFVPGWYAGTCQRCEESTWVVPGLTWVTCRGCGTTTYAKDHIRTILAEARGWVAPPVRLAEFVVALVDNEASIDDLRKRIAIWGEREHIETIRKSNYAPKRYRLGEVLDRLAS